MVISPLSQPENSTHKEGSYLALLQLGCWTRRFPAEFSYEHP